MAKNMQSGECLLISYNLRNSRYSNQFQIPQIVGSRNYKKLQSEEFPKISYNLRNSRYPIQCQVPQTFQKNMQREEFPLIPSF